MPSKPSPTKYAPITPRMRAILPKLLTSDRVRELVAQPSLEEALSLLKDTIYGEAIKSTTLRGVQRDLAAFYVDYIVRIKSHAPKDSHPLIDAFLHEFEAGDLLTLAVYSSTRSGEMPDIVTKSIDACLSSKLAKEPEALVSFTRFLEYLQGTWASRYVNVIRRVAEMGDPTRITWAKLAITAGEYSLALQALDPRLGRPMAAKPICPLLNWTIAAFLIQAKKEGLEARFIDEVLVDVPACGFNVRNAKAAYEREPGPDSLAGVIEEIVKYVKIDVSKDLVEALEEARNNARRKSVQLAKTVFSSYPFHAGLIAAGLTLLKINIEDLLTVLTGISLRLSPEEYLTYTIFA
ncbi:MAG: V-type ATPase subunit [Desulfurococcales archaeon]|nr:V-type ATPase subunit [Desulfurococcales archaeon]MCE4626848.1 V-type ATPase subunit [Desulfurococcales archaeon]MCE4629981.1 V-type ATPase subunit [Desulfurococcales archaeon]